MLLKAIVNLKKCCIVNTNKWAEDQTINVPVKSCKLYTLFNVPTQKCKCTRCQNKKVTWPKGHKDKHHLVTWSEVVRFLLLFQFRSPDSCSSHVASSARPASAHPQILLSWRFQENPRRLGACLVKPKGGKEGGSVRCADLAGTVLSAGSSVATDAHCSTDNPPKQNRAHQSGGSMAEVILTKFCLFF